MSKLTALSIPMSQIIAADAPLLSPVSMGSDNSWDQPLFSPTDNFTYAYYNLPPSPPLSDNSRSPVQANRMLKMHGTQDTASDACLPTHQLFDFPAEVEHPPTPPSRSPSLAADDAAHQAELAASETSSVGNKRSASPAPSATKKRAIGERISSKDFIPPDVSGLSKREARLVKNRAAAFLSRQRKREEFECMEVRVAELEQENARLLALTQNGNGGASSPSPPQQPQSDIRLVSEVELLKAQLAAAQERERTLSAQLASSAASKPTIKLEATESNFSALASPPRPIASSSNIPPASAHKSGASLGLMVLLCALPSLLSMRMQSTPTSFSIPNPFPASASAFDYPSSGSFMPSEYGWASKAGSLMDLDSDHLQQHLRAASSNTMKKLEFTGVDGASPEMGAALGDLDISFDTTPSDDGKIRVRIHSPSSAMSSREGSPGVDGMNQDAVHSIPSSALASPTSASSSSLAMWSGPVSSESEPSFSQSSSSQRTSSSDPFLGFAMPFTPDGGLYGGMDMDMGMGSSLNFDYQKSSDSLYGMSSGSEYSVPDSTTSSGKRRVRIALKSMPQAGGEGGEWEVQIC